MDTARYRAFLEAAETKSFSKAAKKLNYTPSGVSQLVSALEKELRFSLFVRESRGVILTKEGETMLPAIREMLLQETRVNQLAAQINGMATGTIRIAAYSSIASNWLPVILKNFQERYPQITIELREGIRQEVVGWLDTKQADVGFLSYQEPFPYDWFPIAEDPMLAVLPPDHPLADAEQYPLEQVAEERFIMPALGRDDDVAALFRSCDIKPMIAYSTLENYAAISMIEQGLGMSIMNELITNRWNANVRKLPLDPPSAIILGIAVPSMEHASPAVKRFVEACCHRNEECNGNEGT